MLKKSDSRHRLKRSIITGATPTFNSQEDFTDGSFTIFDTRPGEFFWNMADQKLWLGNLSGFNQVQLLDSGGTAIFSSVTYTDGVETPRISAQTQLDLIVDGVTASTTSSASTVVLVEATFEDNVIVSGDTTADGDLTVNGISGFNDEVDFNQNNIIWFDNGTYISRQYIYTAQTTNATVTNVATFPMNNTSVHSFKISVVGNGGSNAYTANIEQTISGQTTSTPTTIGSEFRNENTTNSLLGSDVLLETFLGVGVARVRVAGLAATTFNWLIKLELNQI